jgi:hypothetical protein
MEQANYLNMNQCYHSVAVYWAGVHYGGSP